MVFLVTWVLNASVGLLAQPKYDYSNPFVCTSQLGFRPLSPKMASFFGGIKTDELPEEIPFFIQRVGDRLPRKLDVPKAWGKSWFRYPYNIVDGPIEGDTENHKAFDPTPQYRGTLQKKETRWGTIWQGDFTDFKKPGFYQVETEYGFTVPFEVAENVYTRLERSYLQFMSDQRSGVDIPGVRPAENADDARLYSNESIYLPVAGGWNDAGDWRKWLFLTLGNVEALTQIIRFGHPAFKQRAINELLWGNAYFHHMVNDDGLVYEDVGGGINRSGDYETTWWNENHSGVTAAGDNVPDGIPMNGDERHIRENHNPLVQFLFVRHQALASTVLPSPYKSNCLVLADKAWRYSQQNQHDQRTLFIAEELFAALELFNARKESVKIERIRALVNTLLERQMKMSTGLSGYFMEAEASDGYRSVAFSAEPALALLRFCELNLKGFEVIQKKAETAIKSYIDNYLLADAATNPFGLPPYGVYTTPPFPKDQLFRTAGNGRFVRTFLHVFHENPIPHGTSATRLQLAYLMARAGKHFKNQNWKDSAEKILQWCTGHNTNGLCLYYGVGFKHAVPANFVNYNVPNGVIVGYLGTPEDKPYLETSHAIEWSSQEVWDVPFYYTIGLISYLR